MTPSDYLPSQESYALVAAEAKPVAAPVLSYAPPMPRDSARPIRGKPCVILSVVASRDYLFHGDLSQLLQGGGE